MKDQANQDRPIFMKAGTESQHVQHNAQEAGCASCAENNRPGIHSHPLQLQGRAEMVFPCEFIIKAIGLQADDLAEHTHGLIVKHAPDLKMEHLQIRASSKGKYLSVSATINAISREQLDSIYRELSNDPRILYTL